MNETADIADETRPTKAVRLRDVLMAIQTWFAADAVAGLCHAM